MDSRVDALLEKMTLAEKIGQMTMLSATSERHESLTRTGQAGAFLNITDAHDIARYQKLAREESRLGIPLLFAHDVIHGLHTIFPIPLAEAASWDLALIENAARVAAREAAATGLHCTFAPMVDIARDARWGRIAEGAGEDVVLGSAIARARVRGFQGRDPADPDSVAACVKHYAAYGAAEGGRDYHTVDISERTLREVYLPPFKAAIDEGCLIVMSSFNELSGVPGSASEFTLRQILREEWGFEGFVVSDWDSVGEIVYHGYARDRAEAALRAVRAGVDMDMTGFSFSHLARLVEEKKVPLELIDDAVRRIIGVKVRLGLFERPLRKPERVKAVQLSSDHREMALAMARRCMVLLKNDGATLPLSKGIRSVAVVGPLADNREDPLGTWSALGRADDVVSVLMGIRAIVSPDTIVRHARGCDFEGDLRTGFDEAIAMARESDVVVAVLGERSDMSGEAHSRVDIGLPGPQLQFLQTLQATGRPVVLVVMNGRPMSLAWEAENVPAILVAWHLGIAAGTAVAEALFGDVNPSGKLPASFPRTVGQCPIYYNVKASGRPRGSTANLKVGYVDSPMTPLYPFGHGLSYTRFEYSDLVISPESVALDGALTVSATVTNTGERDGDEVVQLYIRDPIANTTRPIKELKAFQRMTVAKGQSRKVVFELPAADLSFYDTEMKLVVEPGTIQVWVGPSSAEGIEESFELVAAEPAR